MTSIIILTYNRLDCTKRCVHDIILGTEAGEYEITVVDNGSTDGTRDWLNRQHESGNIKNIYLNLNNLGVPAGWNVGLRLVDPASHYIVILNNDVFVSEGWLDKLIAVAESNPKIGMVGPITNYSSGPQCGAGIGPGMVVPFWRLVGFCLLIKREVIEKVGLFDERFGRGNFEDDDYCVRVIEAGYKNVICGDCFVEHAGSASWEPGALNEQLIKNEKIFNEKWPKEKLAALGIIR